MKYIRKILLAGLVLCSYQYAYADGGTWRTTCTKNVACPAGQTGYITLSTTFSNSGGMKCDNPSIYWGNAKTTANTCVNSAPIYKETKYDYGTKTCPSDKPDGVINTKQSYDVWSDGSIRNVSGFQETSRTCAAIYVRTDYDYGTLTCPSDKPSGIINTKQSYDVWSDGTIKNVSGFFETGRNCTPIKLKNETEYRNIACAAGQSGGITQSRTYDRWTDGVLKNYSKWGLFENTCSVKNEDLNKDERSEMCPIGYTGVKIYKWEGYYTDDSYSTVDNDGVKTDYILSTFHQHEVLKSNTCKEIPTQNVETKDGVQEESCDVYLGAASGSFSGTVYKYGEYTTTYNSQSKSSNTVFDIKSIDKTSCKAQSTDMTVEKKTEDCEIGETGYKKYLRYKATNSKSEVTYPYGDWAIFENTCVKPAEVENIDKIESEKVTGLLSNMSFTSTNLINDNSFEKYLKTLSDDGWVSKEKHKLTLNIDDLSNGVYNKQKVSSLINKFNYVVGENNTNIKIILPKTLNKLVGNGPITQESVSGKKIEFSNIKLVGNNAVVTYLSKNPSGRKIDMPIERTVVIPVFDSGTNTKNIRF